MKVECAKCKKVYTFKKEKLPPYAFSFRCKDCNERIQISQTQLDSALSAEKGKDQKSGKRAAKLPKLSLPKLQTGKLKKPFVSAGGVVSKLLSRSERDKLTFLAKYTVYFSVSLLFIVVVLGVLTWFSIGSGKPVTFDEVRLSLELKRDPFLEIQTAVPDLRIPALVQKYIGDDNREAFVEWMNGLQKHQRKDFIENLVIIIRQARALDPQHVQDFISEYQKLKFNRTTAGPITGYLLKLGLIVALLAGACLFGLFSIVLLELAALKPAVRPAAKAPAMIRPKRARPPAKSANPGKK